MRSIYSKCDYFNTMMESPSATNRSEANGAFKVKPIQSFRNKPKLEVHVRSSAYECPCKRRF